MSTRICGILLACSLLASCSNGGSASQNALPAPNLSAAPLLPLTTTLHISHITLVIMENYDYEQIIGSSAAPYTNALARANASFTNSHAVAHPSQPNYLALFSGSTHGVTSDYCPENFNASNLATVLMSHGFTFQGYAENWPASGNPCYGTYSTSVGSRYMYWRKHIPWADFTNLAYRTYGHSYSGSGTVLTGTVNFVVPNICDDMHDCSIAAGDAWLSRNIPAIQNYDVTHNGLLIVTFDEGEYSSTNHIVTIMSGPMVVPGSYAQYITHYNVLRLIESSLGLPLLGSSASATPISGVIK